MSTRFTPAAMSTVASTRRIATSAAEPGAQQPTGERQPDSGERARARYDPGQAGEPDGDLTPIDITAGE